MEASTSGTFPVRLDIIWSAPITATPTTPDARASSQGFIVDAAVASRSGSIILLGTEVGRHRPSRVLLFDAERATPNAATPINFRAPLSGGWWSLRNAHFASSVRNRVLQDFIPDARSGVWLAGFATPAMSVGSHSSNDAYFARLDGMGRLLWEKIYRGGDWRVIESITPVTGGGLVAVGRGGRGIASGSGSKLTRIGSDGALLLEREFGNGKGAGIVRLRNGSFLVAGYASVGNQANSHDIVSTWVFDKADKLHAPKRIRGAVNRSRGSHFGQIGMSVTGNGAYVTSSWNEPSNLQAVEIARVDAEGAMLWRLLLPNTVSYGRGSNSGVCEPALATLANGDALVACALNGEIELYQIDKSTGRLITARLPLPTCQRTHPTALFLIARPDGTVIAIGSRPKNNEGANCSWIGRLRLITS